MRKTLSVAILAVAMTSFVSAADLKIATADSKIEFLGTKTGGKHIGGFKKFTGTVATTGADLAGATITVEIDTDSIFTDTARLTNHLKTADFFEVNKFPKATFKSTAIKANKGANGATHEIAGELTLHGVTKAITIPVKATTDGKGTTLQGTFTILKEDFGMNYGKGMINNEVKVTINVKTEK